MTFVPLLILDTQPPSLLEGYDDFRLEMAAYLGYGPDQDLWTTAEDVELDRKVQEVYRYILYPNKIPAMGFTHVWSWLRRWTTLTTTASAQTQQLPADFGSMTTNEMEYDTETGWVPVRSTRIQEILRRNQWESYEERPWLFATRWKSQGGGGNQRQEIMFYPTPDTAYTLHYEYAVLADKLSKRNPYPLGGPRMSQLMIEACKAVGEAAKNGARGDQWNIFREQLADVIDMDASTLTERTVGQMRSQYSHRNTHDGRNPFCGVRSLSGSTYLGVG